MKWYRGLNEHVRARIGALVAVQDHPLSLLIIGKWALIITQNDVPIRDRDQYGRVVWEATTVRVDNFRDEAEA